MDELYRIILDHSKEPRNQEPLLEVTSQAEWRNSDCGDHIKLFVNIIGGMIKGISFSGKLCSIGKASASLMTEHVKGLTSEQCLELFDDFNSLVTVDIANKNLGKLQAFAEVKDFPVRARCAMLPWHALKSALENSSVSI